MVSLFVVISSLEATLFDVLVFFLGVCYTGNSRSKLQYLQSAFRCNSFQEFIPDVSM